MASGFPWQRIPWSNMWPIWRQHKLLNAELTSDTNRCDAKSLVLCIGSQATLLCPRAITISGTRRCGRTESWYLTGTLSRSPYRETWVSGMKPTVFNRGPPWPLVVSKTAQDWLAQNFFLNLLGHHTFIIHSWLTFTLHFAISYEACHSLFFCVKTIEEEEGANAHVNNERKGFLLLSHMRKSS